MSTRGRQGGKEGVGGAGAGCDWTVGASRREFVRGEHGGSRRSNRFQLKSREGYTSSASSDRTIRQQPTKYDPEAIETDRYVPRHPRGGSKAARSQCEPLPTLAGSLRRTLTIGWLW